MDDIKMVAGRKKRDAAATTAAILEAAKAAFATVGYREAGLRQIAAAAGVDPALVKRYFGSKEKLYEAALETSVFIDNLIAGGRENFGKHVTHYLTEAPGQRFNSLPMMIFAAADPVVKAITLEVLDRNFVRPLGDWLGGGTAGQARAARMLLVFTGLFTYSDVLPLKQFSTPMDSQTKSWIERSLQAIVDEDQD